MATITAFLALAAFAFVWFSIAKKGKASGKGFIFRNTAGGMVGFISFIAVLLIMPGGGQADSEEPAATAKSSAPDVVYLKLKDEEHGTIKRTVEVQIKERIDEATLERLAHKTRDERSTKYDRTFIGWRIAGAEPGPYCATTNFTPDLKIQILNF